MSSATPTSQKISIVRGLSTCAFGRIDVLGHADTSSDSTPSFDSNIDAVNPAPPPPTINTGTSTSFITVSNPAPTTAAIPHWMTRSGLHHTVFAHISDIVKKNRFPYLWCDRPSGCPCLGLG